MRCLWKSLPGVSLVVAWRLVRHVRRFRTVASGRIVLHYAPELHGDVYFPVVFERYEAELEYLTQRFGYVLPGRVVVFLFANFADIGKIFGSDHGGYALMSANAICVAAGSDSRELIRHEFAHLFSARLNWRAPLLLSEGLSVWMQDTDNGMPIEKAAQPLFRDRTLTLTRLLTTATLFSERGPRRHSCYLLAGSFTGFLIGHYGWERYLQFYCRAKGIGFHATFNKCFGVSLESAESDWRGDTAVRKF
jgi:hypothetical protein